MDKGVLPHLRLFSASTCARLVGRTDSSVAGAPDMAVARLPCLTRRITLSGRLMHRRAARSSCRRTHVHRVTVAATMLLERGRISPSGRGGWVAGVREGADAARREGAPVEASEAACMYPWCTRPLRFRPRGSGRQPLFCGQVHRDRYGRERRSLERQLAVAREAGQADTQSLLEWKLIRYPSLRANAAGCDDGTG